MKLNSKSIVLLFAVAVVIIGSVLAVSAAAPNGADSLTTTVAASCGDLRMDEQYACRYGGWQPAPAAVGEQTPVGVSCAGLRLDEYYACRLAGWQADPDEAVRSR